MVVEVEFCLKKADVAADVGEGFGISGTGSPRTLLGAASGDSPWWLELGSVV